MAHSYTPGLKVTERTLVRKARRLPLKGDVVRKLGDRVSATDVVARTDLPGKIYPINVANVLGVGPEALPGLMRKHQGDGVQKDELVAQTPGFMGLFKSEWQSPVSGTIESISRVTGQVIIQEAPIPVEVKAYINGEVVEILPDEGVVVESEAVLVQGIFGLGGEVYAPLKRLATSPGEKIDAARITPDLKGFIVLGGAFCTLSALRKAIEVGVVGFITGGFNYVDIKDLLGYEVGVAITGTEKLGLTLIVTEGFGAINMAQATFDLLSRYEGRYAAINGATQIRAGVIRPEVIVTHDGAGVLDRENLGGIKGTEIGDLIRVIRAPYFGRIGKVKGLPVELRQVASETMVRVMAIEFEDGTVVELPRANVEMIER